MATVINAPVATKPKLDADQEKQEFLKVFNLLRDEIVNDDLLAGQPDSSKQWVTEMLDYNVPLGKLNRGMAVLDAARAVSAGKELTEEQALQARVLGWCIEFLQAYFLVADDIMDNSITRRGQPCWYRVPKVGLVAINDGIILESCIYRILKKHFGSSPTYVHLLDLFHEVTHQTAHGQLLDTTTAPIGTVDLTRYTLPTYMRIVTYKTAFYTFYLPVACGLRLGGVTDPAAYALAEEICVEMGQYFQIQDDFLDCFGDPEVIGKVGTDIEDNKCSWLVVQALDRTDAAQRAVLEAHYGKSGEEDVAAVKAVYKALNLEKVFRDYEQGSHEKLMGTITGQKLIPEGVFLPLLKKIYKRQK